MTHLFQWIIIEFYAPSRTKEENIYHISWDHRDSNRYLREQQGLVIAVMFTNKFCVKGAFTKYVAFFGGVFITLFPSLLTLDWNIVPLHPTRTVLSSLVMNVVSCLSWFEFPSSPSPPHSHPPPKLRPFLSPASLLTHHHPTPTLPLPSSRAIQFTYQKANPLNNYVIDCRSQTNLKLVTLNDVQKIYFYFLAGKFTASTERETKDLVKTCKNEI